MSFSYYGRVVCATRGRRWKRRTKRPRSRRSCRVHEVRWARLDVDVVAAGARVCPQAYILSSSGSLSIRKKPGLADLMRAKHWTLPLSSVSLEFRNIAICRQRAQRAMSMLSICHSRSFRPRQPRDPSGSVVMQWWEWWECRTRPHQSAPEGALWKPGFSSDFSLHRTD